MNAPTLPHSPSLIPLHDVSSAHCLTIEVEEDEETIEDIEEEANSQSPSWESFVWKKVDITNLPLSQVIHPRLKCVMALYEYFLHFISVDTLEHIVYQTKHYTKHKDKNTSFVFPGMKL